MKATYPTEKVFITFVEYLDDGTIWATNIEEAGSDGDIILFYLDFYTFRSGVYKVII